MSLVRLVYASTAAAALRYTDLVALMRESAARNQHAGLTGMLVFGNGHFLQVLEGERGQVSRLYHSIAGDARHRDCVLMHVEPIAERQFGEWSMKLCGLDDMATARRRRLLTEHTGRTEFVPHEYTAAEALGFVGALARSERRAARQAAS